MQLLIGGCRGGRPVTEPGFQRYGGDTTSFLIEGEAGERLIIDAGTGIQGIARHLSQQNDDEAKAALLLFSHIHLDHIMGFPACKLLQDPSWSIEVAMARRTDVEDLEAALRQWMAPPWWPVTLDDMPAIKEITMLDESGEGPLIYGGLQITWCPLCHPGGSTAFRIDEPATESSVVIATDMEWATSTADQQMLFEQLCSLPEPASLLVFDGKCAPEDYPRLRGYGHSTWQEGIDLALRNGIDRLLITHHDPSMDDHAGVAREETVQAAWGQAGLARQGMQITI
jgi:phosphoribosyl 1,2-cyclic phosphodiesterase